MDNTKEKEIFDINLTRKKNGKNPKKEAEWYKSPVFWIILFFISVVFGFSFFFNSNSMEVEYGEAMNRIVKADYEKVDIEINRLVIYPKDKAEKIVVATIPDQRVVTEDLRRLEINPTTRSIFFKEPPQFDFFTILIAVSFVLLTGAIIWGFISTRNITSGGPMMGFGDSKAKLFIGKKQDIKFHDIQGADEAVDEVKELVSFLKTPEKYIKVGARIPKGVLLVGSPGTGKTLLARAIAGEAEVPFFFTSGSEFEEMLVGAGASRVRDLFAKAKKNAPSIIFIDEIDSIARKRGTIIHSGNTEQTLNQILVEMDGFDKNTNVIIIAATNRPDVLDPAIMRPGRFDRRIMLELPDVRGRLEILKVHSKNKPLAKDVDLETVAKRTIGFSGADLENALNEAAINAAKENRTEITAKDIEEAATKVTIGPAKKRAKSDKMKKVTAYHEAGHALAGFYMEEADQVHRISIVSRGYTGGVTMYIPDEDVTELKTDKKFFAELVTLFGGRTAEKLNFDSITTGASSDIQRATQIARDMVKKYGMSKLGYVDLDAEDDYVGNSTNPYSEKTAEQIDSEVNEILVKAQKECERILSEHKEQLDKIANELIEKEVIEGDDFYVFMKEGQFPVKTEKKKKAVRKRIKTPESSVEVRQKETQNV